MNKGSVMDMSHIKIDTQVCIFEIMFDKNTFSVSFDSDLFWRPGFTAKIDEIRMTV